MKHKANTIVHRAKNLIGKTCMVQQSNISWNKFVWFIGQKLSMEDRVKALWKNFMTNRANTSCNKFVLSIRQKYVWSIRQKHNRKNLYES